MMLIIEIHVDTIDSADAHPSTENKRLDDRPKRANQKSNNTGNRFWNAIKLSIPGSLMPQNNNER